MTDSAPPDTAAVPRRTALYDEHARLGAKFADFAGWSMPIEYSGTGVLKEHAAVRERVGLFDVSHLGTVVVRGSGARDHVNAVISNDLDRISVGHAQYTLVCDDGGGVVDDLIVYLRADDELLLVPNAANAAAVVDRVSADIPTGVSVDNVHAEFGVLAVQGPRADQVIADVGLAVHLDYMQFLDLPAVGERPSVTVCRTGYTGERGYEVVVRSDAAPALWRQLLTAVAAAGGVPAGLAARDTLRTEMGYPLHGHELSDSISPLQARAGWAVGWNKPVFSGRAALLAEKQAGPRRTLRGLRAEGRGVPRSGMRVLGQAGAEVGVVTSGTFSPTLQTGIALALVDTSAEIIDGDVVEVDVRGRALPVRVVRPPFVASHVR